MNATRCNVVDTGHNPKQGGLNHNDGFPHPERVNRRCINDQSPNAAASQPK